MIFEVSKTAKYFASEFTSLENKKQKTATHKYELSRKSEVHQRPRVDFG